jgi:hypothetical protein
MLLQQTLTLQHIAALNVSDTLFHPASPVRLSYLLQQPPKLQPKTVQQGAVVKWETWKSLGEAATVPTGRLQETL